MVYGYASTKTPRQAVQTQINKIKELFPESVVCYDDYKQLETRPSLKSLIGHLKEGDTVIMDTITRAAEQPQDASDIYIEIIVKGARIQFIKDSMINSDLFASTISQVGDYYDNEKDVRSARDLLFSLLDRQIQAIFMQERTTAEQRSELLSRTIRQSSSRPGRRPKDKIQRDEEEQAKLIIKTNAKAFGGWANAEETAKLAGISISTYYRYVKSIQEEIESEGAIN